MSADEWYNAVQTQVGLAKYPKETAEILQREIFWYFLKDESFVSKILNEGCVELSKFPASKVRQMAKKLESSQATAKHMRQVTKDPQTTQVNLSRHQRTELPPNKVQRKQNRRYRSRQVPNKHYQEDKYKERMPQDNGRFHKNAQEHTSPENRCSKCGVTSHIEGFRCPASRVQCKHCHKFGHFSKLCYNKNESGYKKNTRIPRAHQLMIGRASAVCDQLGASFSSSEDSFCLQMQIKSAQAKTRMQAPEHLVRNIEYKLKPHRRRTKFLRAKIDTCSNVNVMPVSVYKLIYQGPDYAKLVPNNKDGILTCTTDKIKIIGSCEWLVVHPDTKCFKEVTLQVESHEGSVIVSGATSIDLNLISFTVN